MVQPTDFFSAEDYYEALEARQATPAEAAREYAANVGQERPERPWILTDYDTWERNPFYRGPPAPHPEDDADDRARENAGAKRVEMEADRASPAPRPDLTDPGPGPLAPKVASDDVPF